MDKCTCETRDWFRGDKSWTYTLSCPIHGQGTDCGIIPVNVEVKDD